MPNYVAFLVEYSYFCSMKLIADSGSTKTDWVLVDDRGAIVGSQKTEGINPVHLSTDQIKAVLDGITIAAGQQLEGVFFYGSGLRPEYRQPMRHLLKESLGAPTVMAESDMLGAARALCGTKEGIACILGTGANSCLYDGHCIVQNTPAMGYVLGDEGSGAVLGRNLLNRLYKGQLPRDLLMLFEQEEQMSMASVIERVYRKPLANRWLASLTHFIYRHLPDYPSLSQMVVDSFCDFLRFNVAPYHREDLPVSAIGSIAWYFQTELAQAAALCGMRMGRVDQSPVEGLIDYHCRH